MIQYFWEGLTPSIWAQLDAQGRKLNSWEEAIKKAVNIKVKTLLQSSSSTHKMESRCPQGNKPMKKEEKDPKRTKSIDTLSADTSSSKY